jgi:MerR family copper efflux transcriptional regulator
MNIGQAATASGVTAKMIRYYEHIGLVMPTERTDSNYRHFGVREINELRFIKLARSLGLSVETIAELLSLWRDRDRPFAEIKALADAYAAGVEMRVAETHALAGALRELSARCESDQRPHFPRLVDPLGDLPAPTQRLEPQGLDDREEGSGESSGG